MNSDKISTCMHCALRFDEPKLLPCGNTICNSCVQNFIIEQNPLKTAYKCPICDKIHDFSPQKAFQTNKLIAQIIKDQYFAFYFNDESVEKLKSKMDHITSEKRKMERFFENGSDAIKSYCQEIKLEVDLAVEEAVNRIHTIQDELHTQVNAYEKTTLDTFEQNAREIKVAELNKALYDEISRFELDLAAHSIDEALRKAEDFCSKLNSKRDICYHLDLERIFLFDINMLILGGPFKVECGNFLRSYEI